jgi:hypothetical protein
MSAPAAKAFWLPVMKIAPMPRSLSNAASASASSTARSSLSAFSTCGRLMRIRPTRSRRSTTINW